MKTKKLLTEMSVKVLSLCALSTTLFSASELCFWIMYQEEIPSIVKDKIKEKMKYESEK